MLTHLSVISLLQCIHELLLGDGDLVGSSAVSGHPGDNKVDVREEKTGEREIRSARAASKRSRGERERVR